jgi:hypothetical protein
VGGAGDRPCGRLAGPDVRGRIHFLAPSATGTTRTFPAEIALENPDGALKAGHDRRVSLVRRTYDVGGRRPARRPAGARPRAVAIVLDGDVARVRPVSLGALEGRPRARREGWPPGDWLIVSGHRGLVDGQRVSGRGATRMTITDLSIRHRLTVYVLMVFILVAGTGAYTSLPRESFPEVEIPLIVVYTGYLGASPEDIETLLTRRSRRS